MGISPEDFSSDTPPSRPIGIECEYNLQLRPPREDNLYALLDPKTMAGRGIKNHKSYLGSEYGAGRVYPDVGHLEFATRESNGPASAAFEDVEGIKRVSRIVENFGVPHEGLYRFAGTYIPDGRVQGSVERSSQGRTSGYHQNFLLPREVSEDRLLDNLIASLAATQLWAMGGTLRAGGFVFSQKAWGIGDNPVERGLLRRISTTAKPMFIIPPVGSDADTLGNKNWARVERRLADPGSSLVTGFASCAEMSLAIRLIEQQERLGRWRKTGAERIRQTFLKDPVQAVRLFAGDLSLKATADTTSGKSVTALDLQEQRIELYEYLDSKVELPEDEKLAIGVLRGLTEALRQSNPAGAEYTKLARIRVGFASKHQFISKDSARADVVALNPSIMHRTLLWDQVLPQGPGSRYWGDMNTRDPLAVHIKKLAVKAGYIGRSVLRAKIVDESIKSEVFDGAEVINWAQYRDANGSPTSLGRPIG